MAIKVTLGNASQITDRLTVDIGVQDHIKMSRGIYQYLRSLKNAREIIKDVDEEKVTKELIELLTIFNDKQDGEIIEEGFEELDEYLGSLDKTVDYYYTKDVVDVIPWIEAIYQAPTRNVVYDNNGITENVVYRDGSNVYNVAHRVNNS